MKAAEIRQITVGKRDRDAAIFKMLQEIAAQLAELNEKLPKLEEPAAGHA
jgi:hypothetical protein